VANKGLSIYVKWKSAEAAVENKELKRQWRVARREQDEIVLPTRVFLEKSLEFVERNGDKILESAKEFARD
jgi:hypothetical protein